MADIFVHNFVENLRKLMKSKHRVFAGEKDQLQSLYNDVYHLSSFLKKTEHDDDEKVNNPLVMEIRKVVREADIIVDTFIVDAIAGSSSAPPLSKRLKTLRKQIDAVKIGVHDQMNANLDQMKKMTTTSDNTISDEDGRGGDKIIRTGEEEEADLEFAAAVGIDQTIEMILDGLIDGEQSMEVISAVGLPGIGKTTLARKVFHHSSTRASFQIRAWVTVSQTYSTRRLLVDILKSSSLFQDDDLESSDDKLGEELLKRLKGQKYLIVLDDIWSTEAWYGIQRSFPDENNGSRVLLTSRSITIGRDLSRDINTHNVCGLSVEHSWNLLQNKVFGDLSKCPTELEKFGMEIVKKCDGLPLAIVVIGGLLAKKDKTPKVWKQVARSLRSALATDREAYMDTLALSYKDLPLHLKACFLYIGAFPEDYKIPVRSLIWLLVAEGLVIQDQIPNVEEGNCLEVTVESYLNELVERNLVIVSSKTSCGSPKTFLVHDLLRDFCIVRGKQENFITQLTSTDVKSPSFGFLTGHRCLYVDDQALDLILKWPGTPNLRLLVHITDYLSPSYTKKFETHKFKLLKVLELLKYPIKSIDSIENLVHLKYLGVSFAYQVKILPSSITKLLKLETLFLRTRSKIFDLPNDVWYMVKLRHIFIKGGGVLHFKTDHSVEAIRGSMKESKRNPMLWSLQTLQPLCGCKTCITLLGRTPNIRKLGLSEDNLCGGMMIIPDLRYLKQLESLSIKRWWNTYTLGNHNLPASLRKLTLRGSTFMWDELSLLAKLENLEVLKLLDHVGLRLDPNPVWDTSEIGFPRLKYLKMRKVYIHKWEDCNLQFESLEILVLEDCRELETIPFDLGVSPLLHTIEVTRCNASVETLAKDIEEDHQNQCGNSNLRVFITSHN